jgi:hypothetical protein
MRVRSRRSPAPTPKLGSPQGIAVDADGTIFVTNFITTYAPGANGDVPPIAVIQGSHTGLFGPTSIAVGFGHRLYVTNSFPTEKISVTVYPVGADGDVAPLATLTNSGDRATGLGDPFGITLACVYVGILHDPAWGCYYPSDNLVRYLTE